MTKTIFIFFLAMCLLSELKAQPRSQSAAAPKFKLGFVKDSDIGCGCSLSLNVADERDRRYVFIHSMDESAFINLDGKDLELRLVDSREPKGKPKVGNRSWETYVAGDVKLRIDYIVRKVCDPNDESCEVTYYKATMTVNRKSQRTTIKTLGLCGC